MPAMCMLCVELEWHVVCRVLCCFKGALYPHSDSVQGLNVPTVTPLLSEIECYND